MTNKIPTATPTPGKDLLNGADHTLIMIDHQSQMAFAKRVTQWEQDTVVNRRMAYNHYFGPNAKKKT